MQFLIQALCAGAINYQACTVSLEQAANQTGTTQTYEQLKQYTEHKIRKQLHPIEEYLQNLYKDVKINPTILVCVGTVYKIYKDNGIVIIVPTRLANEMGVELHPNGVKVQFKWVW